MRDCHSPLSFAQHVVLMPVWLKANQSVCTSWEFVGVRCDERDFTETFLVVVIFLTSMSETVQERKNALQFLWVGSCRMSTAFRHVRSTQKEQINNHKVGVAIWRPRELPSRHPLTTFSTENCLRKWRLCVLPKLT